MPSFDIVSEVDHHEVANAVDQANREVATRFDFKGTDSSFEIDGQRITLRTESEFQLDQMLDMLHGKLTKRGIDLEGIEADEPEIGARTAMRNITIREGIDTDMAKKMVKLVKQSRLKVQASIQGDQVRVTGKKRDDLQAVMALLREAELGLPLQFKNFRD
ncbi:MULTISPECIES: YajQ family cyclic di-GMP-binding protein [unclassified Wenzhouxiangella]|uniref:YajQ family cyclic di-GMP-binding protein n=1 Tax=unclassified Wenzhouxiangella TaxID=2613841 RepID=UPI000E3275B7|nr:MULTISPECIES: YajQ family cyclic di-GMP-binding protein [unclassified Wenzhouxiangella]RFF28187.1 YajQ family cyclic di-GMP-binding protein [Wenzhouxiangella sp. 15181]RFP67946.1 YajQ family cyclic di-GMP-binding protein [Wenzhouxiangella sp. 15190]